MSVNTSIKVSEIERSIPPNKETYSMPNPRPLPKGTAPATVEVKPEVRAADPAVLKEVLAQSDISLNFHRDDKTGRVVIEMIDNATGDPVMQIPNEVSLRLSEMFSKVQGQLFEAKL